MASAGVRLAKHFEAPTQQRSAVLIGMWVFLATEVMLFGGLFMALLVYQVMHPEASREASHHLYLWLGGLNTAVLLTSSFTMALAVTAARRGARRAVGRTLAATVALGLVFLAIKAAEYGLEYSDGLVPGLGPPSPLKNPAAHLFSSLYFAATGIHALHLAIGIGLVCVVALRVRRRRIAIPDRHIVVEVAGLYWHFVDVVWIFLYPALYLMGL